MPNTQHTQHDANLTFLQSKGFDTSTFSLAYLKKALTWLRTTDGDNLMHGEGTGDPCSLLD